MSSMRAVVVTALTPAIAAPVLEWVAHPMRVRFGLSVEKTDRGFRPSFAEPRKTRKTSDILSDLPDIKALLLPHICLFVTAAVIDNTANELVRSPGPLFNNLPLALKVLFTLHERVGPAKIDAHRAKTLKGIKANHQAIAEALALPDHPPPVKRLAGHYYTNVLPKKAKK